MSNSLQAFKDSLATEAFDMTFKEAQEKGVCIDCKKPPVHKTVLDRREYEISGLCAKCWEFIVGGSDE